MPDIEVRKKVFQQARKVVVKVGTNAICGPDGRIDLREVRNLARQIAGLMNGGVSVTLVSSGAIGAGIGELGLSGRPKTIPLLQAAAAVGQGQLMRTFHDIFARHGLKVGQVLLTREDFDNRTRYLNIRNTLAALAAAGVLAIINENDTVAVDEIRFGDNDILAALVTNMLAADLLVMLTSTDGVMKDGQVLDVITKVDQETMSLVTSDNSSLGVGGMGAKLAAAGTVIRAGEAAVIACSREPNILARLLAGERLGTAFVPAKRKMSQRRRWIGQVSRPAGRLVIDDGAVIALTKRGKSLLPSGIVSVGGKFPKGAVVTVLDHKGRQVARGLTNYSSGQLAKIKGLKTNQIAKILGDKPYDEVIHRNNMMVE